MRDANLDHLLVIHIPVSSGPLAWTFMAVLWNGAAVVNTYDLPARTFANLAVWSILVFGLYFLAAFGDYTVGFEMSWLTLGKGLFQRVITRLNLFGSLHKLALAVHQRSIKINTLQWIFAFVIMSILLAATLAVSVPGMFGKELTFRRAGSVASGDSERQALLSDDE